MQSLGKYLESNLLSLIHYYILRVVSDHYQRDCIQVLFVVPMVTVPDLMT